MPIIADLGYAGVEGVTTGTRKPPGGTLTDRHKSANQSLGGIRSVIEQTIAHLKNWKVLKHYRGPLDQFERALKPTTPRTVDDAPSFDCWADVR